MKPIRIWYQSYVDYDNGKTYWDRLRKHLDEIAEPGTDGRHQGHHAARFLCPRHRRIPLRAGSDLQRGAGRARGL